MLLKLSDERMKADDSPLAWLMVSSLKPTQAKPTVVYGFIALATTLLAQNKLAVPTPSLHRRLGWHCWLDHAQSQQIHVFSWHSLSTS
jgi:hypothetical protein